MKSLSRRAVGVRSRTSSCGGAPLAAAREPVGEDLLRWELAVANRPLPADFAGPERTLLEHFVAVHAVEGVAPGIYRWVQGNLEQIERGTFRPQAARLCLDQPLGGDCAFDAFHCAALGMVIKRSGTRGYRSALLEAGTAMGRVQLAAYALAHGASGITFYDDEVSAFLRTQASPILITTIGVPDYRPRPGKRPCPDATAPSPAHLSPPRPNRPPRQRAWNYLLTRAHKRHTRCTPSPSSILGTTTVTTDRRFSFGRRSIPDSIDHGTGDPAPIPICRSRLVVLYLDRDR